MFEEISNVVVVVTPTCNSSCIEYFCNYVIMFDFWCFDKGSFSALVSSQDGDGKGEMVERCIHCFRDFPLSVLILHAEKCKGDMLGEAEDRFKAFLPSVHDVS